MSDLRPGDLFEVDHDPCLYQATELDPFNGTMRHAIVDRDTGKIVIGFSGGVVQRFARIVKRPKTIKKSYQACRECAARPGLEPITHEEVTKALKLRGDSDAEVAEYLATKITDKCDLCQKRRQLSEVRDV